MLTKPLLRGMPGLIREKGIEIKYWTNTAADSVRIWTVTDNAGAFGSYTSSGAYAASKLYKSATLDERGNQVIQFKRSRRPNKVLRKLQLTANADDSSGRGHTGWLCTYYIYDDLNRLRAVVQPKGVELLAANSWNISALSGDILNEQTFRYEYDSRGRTTMKKVPGAGSIFMVYDMRDRLVFTQDSLLRAQNKWFTSLYDQRNRSVLTGLTTFTGGFGALQDSVKYKTTAPDSLLDLVLTGSNHSGIKQAIRSVTMQNEFETSASAELVAENNSSLAWSGEITIIDSIRVNRNLFQIMLRLKYLQAPSTIVMIGLIIIALR